MSLRNLTKFHLKDYRRATIILFCVLLLVNTAQLLLKLFLPSLVTITEHNIFGLSRNVIVIFTLINVVVNANLTFPLMSGFSVTRKNFYFSTILASAIFCVSAAFAETVLSEIGKALMPSLGMEISSGKPFLLHWYLFAVGLIAVSLALFVIIACFHRLGTIKGIFSLILYVGLLNLAVNLMPSLPITDESGLLPLSPETLPAESSLMLWAAILALVLIGWLIYRRAPVRM